MEAKLQHWKGNGVHWNFDQFKTQSSARVFKKILVNLLHGLISAEGKILARLSVLKFQKLSQC